MAKRRMHKEPAGRTKRFKSTTVTTKVREPRLGKHEHESSSWKSEVKELKSKTAQSLWA